MLSRPVPQQPSQRTQLPAAVRLLLQTHTPMTLLVRWKRGEVCMMTTLVLTNEGEHCAQAFRRERARMVAAEPFVATGR